jgi:hypothetical protein
MLRETDISTQPRCAVPSCVARLGEFSHNGFGQWAIVNFGQVFENYRKGPISGLMARGQILA